MKKIVCFIAMLVFAIFLINGVFGISTNLKDSYLQKETIITEINGNIINPISVDNVKIFRNGHIDTPFEGDLKKIGEIYYLWFITPQNEANYTLKINNIDTTVAGSNQQINYGKNFSVLGNLTDYYIKPKFIIINESFEIEVQLNEDYDKSISTEFVRKSNFTLKPGKNIIDFSISGINKTKIINMVIGKYVFPVHIMIYDEMDIINLMNSTNFTKLINLTIKTINNTNLTKDQKKLIDDEIKKYKCGDLKGNICTKDQKCSGETRNTSDGTCCFGQCNKIEKKESSKAWIGYLLAAGVVILLVFIWIKYKKVKEIRNPIESKIKSFEKEKIRI